MARGINKVILAGNLGRDPEVKYMPSGGAVTSVSVATSETWKDKETGQAQERTEWHRVVFFNRLAEIAGEYLRKGSKVYIEGSLRTRKWQAQDGTDRYTTEIVAGEMQMLDGGKQEAQDGGGYSQPKPQAQPQQQRQQPPRQQQPRQDGPHQRQHYGGAPGAYGAVPPGYGAPPAMDSFDDDIPF